MTDFDHLANLVSDDEVTITTPQVRCVLRNLSSNLDARMLWDALYKLTVTYDEIEALEKIEAACKCKASEAGS